MRDSFYTYDRCLYVVLLDADIQPVADAGTIDAVADAEVKHGAWVVHQHLTHDVAEG